MSEIYYDWSPDSMLEVTLKDPDSFLKVRETLTRIGVASKKDKKLFQSAHILHKQGRYFIVHYKEMFAIDGKPSTLTLDDVGRRNTIAGLLEEWKLLAIVDKSKVFEKVPLSNIKVIPYKEKREWELIAKYSIGTK